MSKKTRNMKRSIRDQSMVMQTGYVTEVKRQCARCKSDFPTHSLTDAICPDCLDKRKRPMRQRR